jgi:magnesium-transporting ATPase (P-type)
VLVIPGDNSFQGSSTDEITLVNAAKTYGFELTARSPNEVKVVIQNKGELKFKLLHKIEFTSERKKMTSVLQQEGSNEVLIYTKGADNVIIKAATTEKSKKKLNALQLDLEEFSQVGFRTLCFGVKIISVEAF